MVGRGQRKFLTFITVVSLISVALLIAYAIKSGLLTDVLNPSVPPR